MLKLLLCLFSALAIAVMTLQLRQQRLEINHQALQYHNEIEAQQAKLWSQQLQIAVFTAPNAIAQTVGSHDLHMVPQAPIPPRPASLNETPSSPDAE